jgi:predicted transcriptional regulator
MPNQYYINLHTKTLIESIRIFHQTFPVSSSVSSIEILMHIILLTSKDEVITLKKIYNSVPYAENTVRTYLRELFKSGWITFIDGHDDNRVVCLEITPKFYRTLIQLSDLTMPKPSP